MFRYGLWCVSRKQRPAGFVHGMVGFSSTQATDTITHRMREAVHFHVLRAGEAIGESSRNGLLADLPRPGARAVGITAIAVVAGVSALLIVHATAPGSPADNADAARSTIMGGQRADTITGTSSADIIRTGRGGDVVSAGAGNDRVAGNAGSDTLLGGAGDDVLRAGTGSDVLVGGAGDDMLYAQELDGADRLLCGAGHDVAYVTRVNLRAVDTVVDCERIVVTQYTLRRERR